MITKVFTGPISTSDLSGVTSLHPELRQEDLLVADRGFCSYAHLALLLERGVHGFLRVRAVRNVDFTSQRDHVYPARGKSAGKRGKPRSRWIKTLGETDQIVEWFKVRDQPAWMSREEYLTLPDSIVVRETTLQDSTERISLPRDYACHNVARLRALHTVRSGNSLSAALGD